MAASGVHTVYQITNLIHGKRYIGVTVRPFSARLSNHFSAANSGKQSHLHRSIRKHGRDLFRASILKVCNSREEMLAEEIRLISALQPEYNMTDGGEGCIGYKHTPSFIRNKKLQMLGNQNRRGTKTNPEGRRRMSEAKRLAPVRYWLGKERDEETKRKMSECRIGVPRTPSDQYHKFTPEEIANRAKNTVCLNDGLAYQSAAAAARHYGLNKESVTSVCNGRRNAVYGFRFAYVEQ